MESDGEEMVEHKKDFRRKWHPLSRAFLSVASGNKCDCWPLGLEIVLASTLQWRCACLEM